MTWIAVEMTKYFSAVVDKQRESTEKPLPVLHMALAVMSSMVMSPLQVITDHQGDVICHQYE